MGQKVPMVVLCMLRDIQIKHRVEIKDL